MTRGVGISISPEHGLLYGPVHTLKLPILSLHIGILSGIGITEALLFAISYQVSKQFPLTSTDLSHHAGPTFMRDKTPSIRHLLHPQDILKSSWRHHINFHK